MKCCKECDYFVLIHGKSYCLACNPFRCIEARLYEHMCGKEGRLYRKRRCVIVRLWRWIFGRDL